MLHTIATVWGRCIRTLVVEKELPRSRSSR